MTDLDYLTLSYSLLDVQVIHYTALIPFSSEDYEPLVPTQHSLFSSFARTIEDYGVWVQRILN